jgi:methylated-DNA-[protein]-cysteine S-methyltransferase
MGMSGFVLFDTAVGRHAIVWSGPAIGGVQLDEGSPPATVARLLRRFPAAVEATPPDHVAEATLRIRQVLEGARDDLSDIALDWSAVSGFERRAYEWMRRLLPGDTTTYGEIARALGDPGAARAVGVAMGRNPFPIIIPCHRVLAADGRLGGFSAAGGAAFKRTLLAAETAQAELFGVLR